MIPIRVLIVDDHTILRSALKMLIQSQQDMEVVGESKSAEEAIDLARQMTPDIITLDLSLPGRGGMWFLQQHQRSGLPGAVLVLTIHDDAEYVRTSLAAGAKGYVAKSATDSELLTAIRGVYDGRLFVSVPTDSGVAQSAATPAQLGVRPQIPLNEREHEVLVLFAQGFSNKEIASRMKLSVKTIETYRARIADKLGLRTRAEVFRYVLDNRLM